MADNETYTPAPPRVNATDMAAQNKKMDEAIQREVEHAHKQRKKTADQAQLQADAAKPKLLPALHPLRPFQRAWAFAKGTVHGGLNGLSAGARRGGMLGGVLGLLACIALGSAGGGPALIVLGMIGTASAGAVLGASLGVLTGGLSGVRRTCAIEQAEDAKAPKTPSLAQSLLPTRSQQRKEQKAVSLMNYDRYHQQDLENQRDSRTYWQDRVSADSQGWGRGV